MGNIELDFNVNNYIPLLSKVDLLTIVKSLPVEYHQKDNCTRRDLIKTINEYLFDEGYEAAVKADLVNIYSYNQHSFGFEVKSGGSVADFVTCSYFTPHLTCYEIKTKHDNLSRLPKQIEDYLKIYDYVNVVVDIKMLDTVKKMLPKQVGIYFYSDHVIHQASPAKFNRLVTSAGKLSLFTNTQLLKYFKTTNKDLILNTVTDETIDILAHDLILNRYITKTNWLMENKNKIVPCDYSFFYKRMITPEIVYDDIN